MKNVCKLNLTVIKRTSFTSIQTIFLSVLLNSLIIIPQMKFTGHISDFVFKSQGIPTQT